MRYMPRLEPKELRRISSASRAEKVAATRANKEQTQAFSKAMKMVWRTLVSSALSGKPLVVIKGVTEGEMEALSTTIGLHFSRQRTRDGTTYSVDLNSLDSYESLAEIEAPGAFEAFLLSWLVSDRGEGFILLLEDAARSAASLGKTSVKFMVRKVDARSESLSPTIEVKPSSILKAVGGECSPIGYNYYIRRDCVALDGPDPTTVGFLMELLGYGVAITHSESSSALKLSW